MDLTVEDLYEMAQKIAYDNLDPWEAEDFVDVFLLERLLSNGYEVRTLAS